MGWIKLVLFACFYVTVCHGFNTKKLSTPDLLPPGLPVPDFLKNFAGAWDSFKNLTNAHKGDQLTGMLDLKHYFERFGYMTFPDGQNLTDDFDDIVESAIKMYQRNFGLNVTGFLDEDTVSQLMTPRCGREDVINGTSVMQRTNNTDGYVHGVQHFTFFPGQPRWSSFKQDLTYAFDPNHEVSEITIPEMRTVFARAFQRWADVIPMTFTETDDFSNADIKIAYYSGDHGDGYPFDGPLGTLAHSFSPQDGHLHLDAAETWSISFSGTSSKTAIDLESVATHEIGHILGMGHTQVKDAIMYPSISPLTTKVALAEDDVDGVQSLYGANPNYNGSSTVQTNNQREQTSHAVSSHALSSLQFQWLWLWLSPAVWIVLSYFVL